MEEKAGPKWWKTQMVSGLDGHFKNGLNVDRTQLVSKINLGRLGDMCQPVDILMCVCVSLILAKKHKDT